jgi:hypothetical protein
VGPTSRSAFASTGSPLVAALVMEQPDRRLRRARRQPARITQRGPSIGLQRGVVQVDQARNEIVPVVWSTTIGIGESGMSVGPASTAAPWAGSNVAS